MVIEVSAEGQHRVGIRGKLAGGLEGKAPELIRGNFAPQLGTVRDNDLGKGSDRLRFHFLPDDAKDGLVKIPADRGVGITDDFRIPEQRLVPDQLLHLFQTQKAAQIGSIHALVITLRIRDHPPERVLRNGLDIHRLRGRSRGWGRRWSGYRFRLRRGRFR